uniref:Putative methyltransferase n=1 Tax=viral metagenome TaxID=1070528 RepID=A0A6M3MER9_9ZZZZ
MLEQAEIKRIHAGLLKAGERRYRVILADPPWEGQDQGTRMSPAYTGGQRSVAHYRTLPIEVIKGLPVDRLCQDDALLFLWRLGCMQEEALTVAWKWGFDIKTEIVWCKVSKTGRPRFGGGHYVRNAHEVCLVGARGRAARLIRDRSVPSWFTAERGDHSRKPAACYELIERLAEGPRLEMFATSVRAGWTSWGAKIGGLRSAQ